MSKTTISQKIEDKLNTLMGAGKPLKVVYGEHKLDLDGYPAATFEPSDILSDYETTTQNLRKYVFRIMVHQQFDTIDKEEAIKRTNHASDEIIKAFEQDYTLGGTVDLLKIEPSVDGDYNKDTTPVHFAEIMLEVSESVDITS